jgi:hypothetical protein
LKPPGFTTLERYEVKTRFFLKICFLKCNLYRYIEAYRAESEPLQAEVNAAKSRAAKASKTKGGVTAAEGGVAAEVGGVAAPLGVNLGKNKLTPEVGRCALTSPDP